MTTNKDFFAITEVESFLEQHYSLKGELVELPGYCDFNFRLTESSGCRYTIKLTLCPEPEIRMQNEAMEVLHSAGLKVPKSIMSNAGVEFTPVKSPSGKTFLMRVLTYLEGVLFVDVDNKDADCFPYEEMGRYLGKVDVTLTHLRPEGAFRFSEWDLAHGYAVCHQKYHYLSGSQQPLVLNALERYCSVAMPLKSTLRRSLIHNDANDYNILVDAVSPPRHIAGLIDFGDMVYTHVINELAICCAYSMMGVNDPLSVCIGLTKGYHAANPLQDNEFEVLYHLIALRLCTSLCNGAYALSKDPENEYLKVSLEPALQLLKRWVTFDDVSVKAKLLNGCGFCSDNGRSKKELVDFRKKHSSKALSLTYKDPLKIVRGRGVYLYDEKGNAYLDMVNNVCHVGHCHPKVVAAGQRQMSALNTNTRYLHDNLATYTEKLLATMPEELSVCMLVNSGSEANELAFRLARKYSGSKHILTVEGAYHGHTDTCINASSYKFDGPGGEGAPPHVHKVPLPDPYRGEFAGSEEASGKAYAARANNVIEKMLEQGIRPGAFICESLQGVAGQIVMPDGYLTAVYEKVRQAGGVCIADEVQVGFGRVGTHMWGFESQNVVPDIVSLGKPIGNGHPMAAVITTQKIADAFVTGMEYFNTYGGNPVSCAIGEAVLDVIQEESLMNNARLIGEFLQEKLRLLQQEFSVIGDVRGLGLFIGCELVENVALKTPATKQTARLVEFFKENRVLITTEGPYSNVLKIKPPIVFSMEDAEYFLSVFRKGLVEIFGH